MEMIGIGDTEKITKISLLVSEFQLQITTSCVKSASSFFV